MDSWRDKGKFNVNNKHGDRPAEVFEISDEAYEILRYI